MASWVEVVFLFVCVEVVLKYYKNTRIYSYECSSTTSSLHVALWFHDHIVDLRATPDVYTISNVYARSGCHALSRRTIDVCEEMGVQKFIVVHKLQGKQ